MDLRVRRVSEETDPEVHLTKSNTVILANQ